MIRQWVFLASIVVLTMISQCASLSATYDAAVQTTFHISTDGSDANPGTATKPFATIERARQAIRAINKNMVGDVVAILHGGTYRIDRTITFDAADSGTNGHDVVYRAPPRETPVISGGIRITGWQRAEGKLWKASTAIDDFRQLYVDGVRAVRARSGKIGTENDPSRWEFWHNPSRGGELPGAEPIGTIGYRTTAVDMADWHNTSDLEFCFVREFTHVYCKVRNIRREGDHAVVTMLQPYFTHACETESVRVGLPSYIENALELLDEPGEWYLDRPAKTVYYMPRKGEDMNQVEIIAPAVEKLVELRGTLDQPVQHIRFEGIGFQHGSWLRPSKIGHNNVQANFIFDSDRTDNLRRPYLANLHNENLKSPANVVCHAAKSIRFERCSFTRLGGGGIDIEYGSQNNVVSGCHFYKISGSAVQVGDVLHGDHHPDDVRRIVKDNTVENCYIHDCGIEYLASVGVFVGYTDGTRVAHNEICRLPYTGVSVGWGWGEEDAGGGITPQPFVYDTPTPAKNSRIEMNHIHDVMQPLLDGGGIYTLGNMPGTIIRGNHIHAVVGWPGGIYLDEGSGFIEITGNLVYDVTRNLGPHYKAPVPMNYCNQHQDRNATCNDHDNFFNGHPNQAKSVVAKAGLEDAYRDLLKQP